MIRKHILYSNDVCSNHHQSKSLARNLLSVAGARWMRVGKLGEFDSRIDDCSLHCCPACMVNSSGAMAACWVLFSRRYFCSSDIDCSAGLELTIKKQL